MALCQRQATESGLPEHLWLVLGAGKEEIQFKARNWEVNGLLCSVSLAHEAPDCSLAALHTQGFKPNRMNICVVLLGRLSP